MSSSVLMALVSTLVNNLKKILNYSKFLTVLLQWQNSYFSIKHTLIKYLLDKNLYEYLLSGFHAYLNQ